MPDWLTRIEAALAKAQLGPKVWRIGDGQLLLMPFGARVLACSLPGVEGNLFWHSPEVEDESKARDLNTKGGLAGGDRLWLAPEMAYFWPNIKEARQDTWKTYRVPRPMDPGDWRILEEGPQYLRLTQEVSLHDGRSNKNIAVRLEREVYPIAPPSGLPAGLRSVSFTIRNDLTLLEAAPGAVAGTWDLLQVPSGGDLICPTTRRIEKPRVYYGAFDAQRMRGDDRAFRFKLDGKRQLKIGLAPEETTGRMGYFRPSSGAGGASGGGGGQATLIFRIFQSRPGEPYVDLPLSSDELVGGDALQSYNDDGRFGGFGEMEYHDSALMAGQRPGSRSGSCITHVLAGPDKAVREAGRMLLGVEV